MEYYFRAKNEKGLKRANSAMQQKPDGAVMCLYINVTHPVIKRALQGKATLTANKNGYKLILLEEDY